MSSNTKLLPLLLVVSLFGGSACDTHRSTAAGNDTAGFDYYLFTLSWAPQFCATEASAASSSECDPIRHYGFVVHGLWPQNDDGSYPQHCAPAQPLTPTIVQQTLPIMPSRGLIQHEWATHGTCSGLSPQDYFGAVAKAFARLQIPPEYRSLTQTMTVNPSDIEKKFADANHAPQSAFRVSCNRSEFVGLEVCLTKGLEYRRCGMALRECRAPQITLRPTP